MSDNILSVVRMNRFLWLTIHFRHWRLGAVLNKDPQTGIHYYGTMKCQTALGMFYSDPKMKKIEKAFYWHQKAAQSGSLISEGKILIFKLEKIIYNDFILFLEN